MYIKFRVLLIIFSVLTSFFANASWFKETKKDKFTDEVFVRYRSELVGGQLLSLACGQGPRGSDYDPVVAFLPLHKTSAYTPMSVKIRVDQNDYISYQTWNLDLSDGSRVGNWGNNGHKMKDNVDAVNIQFQRGQYALVKMDKNDAVRFSLYGFTKAFNEMKALCKKTTMEYKTQKSWIRSH